MSKKRIKLKIADGRNERDILTTIDSPFIVGLSYALSEGDTLCLLLDLMIGGDLGYHLNERGSFSVNMAKYFTARLVLGIEALHAQGIVHRDIKPDNCLVNHLGETKLSDFGLAAKVGSDGLLTQICGTRGYWAPEIFRKENGKRSKYSKSVDWFSLGCSLYEFIKGRSPFLSQRAKEWQSDDPTRALAPRVDQAILEMEPDYDVSFMDSTLIDMLTRLLDKNGNTRLGSGGAQEIKAHPWFADINWHLVETGKVPPPFVPHTELNVYTKDLIGVFDESSTKDISLTEEEDEAYSNWNFCKKSVFFAEVVDTLKDEAEKNLINVSIDQGICCAVS